MKPREFHAPGCNEGAVPRQYTGVGICTFWKECLGCGRKTLNHTLLEWPLGPPPPPVPPKPLAALASFNMWSQRKQGPWILDSICLLTFSEALPICDRGFQEVCHLWGRWQVKREGRQREWWVSFSPVTRHLLARCIDQLWTQPRGSRMKMCHRKRSNNDAFYYFVSLWASTPPHPQQVAGPYSNVNTTEWNPMS